MTPRTLRWILAFAAIPVVLGAFWLKSKTEGGLHPFLRANDRAAILTLILEREVPKDGVGGSRQPVFVRAFGTDPPADVLAKLPAAKAWSAYSKASDSPNLCFVVQLVSFSPLSDSATAVARIQFIEQDLFGFAEVRYELRKRTDGWHVDKRVALRET